MPYRKTVFANDEIYHLLNRGINRFPIFTSPKEYQRFTDLLNYYRFEKPQISFSYYSRLAKEDKNKFFTSLENSKKLVEIYAYCLMPSHFHLLMKQVQTNGIKNILSRVENAYVRYFNLKHERLGPLFESMFKAIRIEDEEQLLHVSRYIHLNPSTSYEVEIDKLPKYPWSSLPQYLSENSSTFINMDLILNLIGSPNKYQNFVFDQAQYQRELQKIKHLLFEAK